MSYWFEEPYEAFIELRPLRADIRDQSERRFIAESDIPKLGLSSWLKLIMFTTVEFQIIINGISRLLIRTSSRSWR